MQSPQDLFLKYKQNPQEKTLILLLQALQPIIYAVCFKVVKNEADCQDVTQDVLVKLIHDIHQLQKVETIIGWVHQIAFYTALDFKRDQIKQRAIAKTPLEENDSDPFDDTSHVLHEHIAKLDKESQQLILLKFFDNNTFADILTKTGKAYSSAHDDIQRVLKTLKNSLEKAGYFSIAVGLEKTLETSIEVPFSTFTISQTLSQEIKKAIPQKTIGSMSVTTILSLTSAALILISLVATNILSKPASKESTKQTVADSQKAIVKIEKSNKKAIEANIASELDTKLLLIPDESKQNDLVKLESMSSPTIVKPENGVSKKDDDKFEFSFVNEKNESLFGGKHILLQQGKVEVIKGVEVNFSKDENENCMAQIISDEFFLNEEKNTMTYAGNQIRALFNTLEKTNTITLSKHSILKISLQFKDGLRPLPDGTKCRISCGKNLQNDNLLHINCYGTIKGDVAIFQTELSGLVTVEKIFAENFWGTLKKSIIFTYGEIAIIEGQVAPFKSQEFQVIDSASLPLENYYVYFKENINEFNPDDLSIEAFEKLISKTGKLPLGNRIAITDKNGQAKTIRLFDPEDYGAQCYVFGKNHGIQKISIDTKDIRPVIELKLKNINNLTLNIKLNDEVYLNKIEFSYSEVNSNARPKLGQIIGGQLELPNMISGKYKFTLGSNEFYREVFVIDFDGTNKMEHLINLTPAQHFIHGYIRDKKGNPLEKIELSFYKNNENFKFLTDEKGYFKLSGLDPKEGYSLSITSERPEPVLPELIYASNQELNIILDDVSFLSIKVLGFDGKPIDSFAFALQVYLQENARGFPLEKGESVATNGEFRTSIRSYGYYHIFIELKDAHTIEKVIPILKSEDNIPFVFQAIPGFTVSGIVIDTNEKPIEDVIVTRDRNIYSKISKFTPRVFMTGKDGFIKLENCIAGDFFWIAKNGYTPIPLTIKDEDKKNSIKVTFIKNFQVTGSIKTSDKKPLANINVSGVYSIGEKATYRVWANTDAEGHFVIDNLIPGDWDFSFSFNEIDGPEMPDQKITIIKPIEELNIIYDIPKK